jgi:hypothetical protein
VERHHPIDVHDLDNVVVVAVEDHSFRLAGADTGDLYLTAHVIAGEVVAVQLGEVVIAALWLGDVSAVNEELASHDDLPPRYTSRIGFSWLCVMALAK